MKTGIELITEERTRQITVEGRTLEHDNRHGNDELALAAITYATPSRLRREYNPAQWPWNSKQWKPTPDDRVWELVRAGALIAAEIDRLKRVKTSGNVYYNRLQLIETLYNLSAIERTQRLSIEQDSEIEVLFHVAMDHEWFEIAVALRRELQRRDLELKVKTITNAT